MTSPSADSDLLMACASLRFSPVDPDFLTLRGGQSAQRFHITTCRASLARMITCRRSGDTCAQQRLASSPDCTWDTAGHNKTPTNSPLGPGQVDEAELALGDALRLQVGGLDDDGDDEVRA